MGEGLRWLAVPAPGFPEAPRAGDRVHVAYRPEDLALAHADDGTQSSPRNRARMTVAGLAPIGGLVRVRLEGPLSLIALVTREGAAELGLAPGVAVSALLKAVAARAYVAPPPPLR